MSQGFDTYDDERRRGGPESDHPVLPRRADYQTDVAIKWVSRHLDSHSQQPFFMWVHYFDPHYAYRSHADFDFAPEGVGRLTEGWPIRKLRARTSRAPKSWPQLKRSVICCAEKLS